MKTKLELSDIEGVVASEHYTVLDDSTTTICRIRLKNGYDVIGKSACADPANFDKVRGEEIARKNAFEQIWALEGYLLKQRLHEAAEAAKPPERKPVESRWDHNPMTYEMRFWVKWSDGTADLMGREDAVEVRKSWPWLWAGADMSGY